MIDINSSKFKLRNKFFELRKNISSEHALYVSQKIENKAEEIVKIFKPKVIAGFYPFKNEVNTLPLLRKLFSLGCKICMPVTPNNNKPLKFKEWHPNLILQKGRFGILEPPKTSRTIQPDLLLVPLLAYDKFGNRLGYGGGFYDRTLKELLIINKHTTSIGLAFEIQKCNKLPKNSFDVPLNSILNEKGFLHFKNN